MEIKLVLLFVLCLQMALGHAQSRCNEEDVGAYLLKRESAGEGIITARAALDVVESRMKKAGKNLCQIAFQQGQFPYMAEGLKRVSLRERIRYRFVKAMPNVLDESYTYFNHEPMSWSGKPNKRIGRLYFS